jgi:hypothetical protein
MPPTSYRRVLSAEDADTGTILIEKSRWAMFPPPMEEFAIEAGGQRFVTRIVAEDCSCVGTPHQHLHLEAGHLKHLLHFTRGASITITRGEKAYVIAN